MKIDGIDILGGPSFPSIPDSSNLYCITAQATISEHNSLFFTSL